MVTYEAMIIMLNEGLHHEGLLAPDRYITQTGFIVWMLEATILLIGFDRIFFKDERRARRFLKTYNEKFPLIAGLEYVVVMQTLFLQHGRYDVVLISHIIIATIILFAIVISRKEFDGVREYLYEKFGWLF